MPSTRNCRPTVLHQHRNRRELVSPSHGHAPNSRGDDRLAPVIIAISAQPASVGRRWDLRWGRDTEYVVCSSPTCECAGSRAEQGSEESRYSGGVGALDGLRRYKYYVGTPARRVGRMDQNKPGGGSAAIAQWRRGEGEMFDVRLAGRGGRRRALM